MGLTPYQQTCYRSLRNAVKDAAKKNIDLKCNLESAHIEMLVGAYIAYVWMSTIIAAVVGAVVAIVLFFLFTALAAPLFLIVIAIIFPLMSPLFVYFGLISSPGSTAKARKRMIDTQLPYAVNFIAAMAAAHATPQKIFRSLALQEHIYGEVSKEALWIYRDMTISGADVITALKRGVERSPSMKFADFLQGVISSLTSGGDMKGYFMHRAEFYMRENRREQMDFLETLSFMAESYVVVAVAMPIFLMVIMVIMYWVSGAESEMSSTMLWLIIFGLLPITHAGYVIFIYLMTPKL